MAVPKRKTGRARTNARRSSHKIGVVQSQACPQCNETKLPHRVCGSCGYYAGKEIVAVD